MLLQLLDLLLSLEHAHDLRLLEVRPIRVAYHLLRQVSLWSKGFMRSCSCSGQKLVAISGLLAEVAHLEAHARVRVGSLGSLRVQHILHLQRLREVLDIVIELLLHLDSSLQVLNLCLILIVLVEVRHMLRTLRRIKVANLLLHCGQSILDLSAHDLALILKV